ncbi:lipase [Streptomyces sp. NPDC056121]|uniref:alpha/beta hydrolase n=1 Tax=unclassified Streptomyces TaxID=2593676 RepID=UPI0035E07882
MDTGIEGAAATGPEHDLGQLHLVDHSRRDPWTSPRPPGSSRSPRSPRELMVTLWYPARCPTHGRARAPWLPPEAAALYKQKVSQQLHTSLDTVDLPLTHAYTNAAVEEYGHGLPVVLFSPGYRAQRALGAALVEDLASRGHAVVTIDHTHESDIVEFPGGRLEPGRQPGRPTDEDIAKALRVRQDDTRFVLDELPGLNAGRNPDAEGRPLPQGLCGALGLRRTGMFGHSLGGDTAAEVMAADHRVMAGADLDGSINGSAAATGLDRPFLLMSNASHGRENDPSWEDFWSHLRGWRRSLRLRASGHQTYTDLSPLMQQLDRALPLPSEVVDAMTDAIGTITADRAVAAERACLGAFFDLHLWCRDRDRRLLSGPSPRFPEIEFVP